MFRTVLRREILHNLYSLRFLISLALVLAVFAAGAVSFVRSHAADMEKYRETRGQYLENMRDLAARERLRGGRPEANVHARAAG